MVYRGCRLSQPVSLYPTPPTADRFAWKPDFFLSPLPPGTLAGCQTRRSLSFEQDVENADAPVGGSAKELMYVIHHANPGNPA